MSLRPWLAILICLLLGLSGCMKAVEKEVAVPPGAEATMQSRAQQAPTIGISRRNIGTVLLRVDAADWTIPQIFLAVAGRL